MLAMVAPNRITALIADCVDTLREPTARGALCTSIHRLLWSSRANPAPLHKETSASGAVTAFLQVRIQRCFGLRRLDQEREYPMD